MAEGVGKPAEPGEDEPSFEEMVGELHKLTELVDDTPADFRHDMTVAFAMDPMGFDFCLLITAEKTALGGTMNCASKSRRSKDLTPMYPVMALKLREMADTLDKIQPSGPAELIYDRTNGEVSAPGQSS